MAGDYTRFTFDPIKAFSGVRKQQGRVSLDSDANEFEEILDRRDRAEMYDTVGQAVYPHTTPHAFEILVGPGGKLTIGQGRMYLDGILAECFGDMTNPANTNFDEHMNDLVGKDPLLYDQQPFFYSKPPVATPFPTLSPTAGVINLVYLDVWQREVTVFEDYALREIALNGPDTDTRVQTAWQVKVMKEPADAGSCTTPPAAWKTLIAPSTARLTATATPAAPAPGPCVISPAAGYTGLENRLYRVEVHTAGTVDGVTKAKFKWSRDNASLAARVLSTTKITATDWIITVGSTGRDSWLRFEFGDHVELLDDNVEFAMRESGTGGIMAKVTSVNHATGEIHVDQDLTAFPIVAGRHPRIRRWDIASAAEPFLRNTNNGVAIPLENGISITFGPAAADTLHAGDHWVFAARTADGSIDPLVKQPPRNTLHHFARLALVTSGKLPGLLSDCRIPWPPPIPGGGDNCACTVCVTPKAHASENPSLQMAIQEVIKAGGGTVCLEVGVYEVKQPLLIHGAQSLRITGKGEETVLQAATAAIEVQKGHDVVLESFKAVSHGVTKGATSVLSLLSSKQIRIEHVHLVMEGSGATAAALGLGGALADVLVRGNTLRAPVGILGGGGTPTSADGETGVFDLRVENNAFECTRAAVRLHGITVHHHISRFAGNRVVSEEVGFELTGGTTPGSGVEIVGNEFQVLGDAIVAGVDGLRVVDNDLIAPKPSGKQRGIVLTKGMTGASLDDAQIVGNRIVGFATGVAAQVSLGSVVIARNQIANAETGFFVVQVETLSIDNNQVSAINRAAIRVRSKGGRVAVCGNQLEARAAPGVTIECPGGDCVFSDNHLRQLKSGDKDGVHLVARTLVVASNRILGPKVRVNLEPEFGPEKTPLCTVVGNITGGPIVVAPTGALPMRWALLNLQNIV